VGAPGLQVVVAEHDRNGSNSSTNLFPMNNAAQTQEAVGPVGAPTSHFRFHIWYLVATLIVCLPLWCVIGITGYFRLGSETRALRGSLMGSVGGQWDKKFAVHIGSFTMGLVRYGSHLFHLAPEPRAALDTLHGAEVGIYTLRSEPRRLDGAAIFSQADRAMKSRGWVRVVGVAREGELVGVYLPNKTLGPSKMSCCVMVFHDRELVVASANGNVEPLLEIARSQMGGRGKLAGLF
jgi:hypothetical protein